MSEPESPFNNWASLADFVAREPATPRAEAARAALRTMQRTLGDDWLNGQWLPAELGMAASHTIAFVRLLELAFRLDQFADASGIAVLSKMLRTDRTPERWYHVQLQLELADLLAAHEATIEFERASKRGWPADVLATLGGQALAIEAFAIFTSRAWREAVDTSDAISFQLIQVEAVRGVSIVANVHGSNPDRDELQRWLGEVDVAAAAVAADGSTRTIKSRIAEAAISTKDEGTSSSFRGPPIAGSPFARVVGLLKKKWDQASSQEGVWLRVDLLDGMWSSFAP